MVVNGKKLANQVEKKLKKRVVGLKKKSIFPKCISFVATQDPEGNFYTKLKKEAAFRTGILLKKVSFSFKNPKQLKGLSKLISRFNGDKKVHGLMIQKPAKEVILKNFKTINHFQNFWLETTNLINPEKDVDCLTSQNLGRLLIGQPRFLPATVAAIIKIIMGIFKSLEMLEGKNIVILGSSPILGKPLALFLKDNGATVTLCGSKTKDLLSLTKVADIIVSCVGHPKLITKEMVGSKSIIIDAGTKKVGQKIVGDADFENIKDKVVYITPVPGGVGPLTVISLLENIVLAAENLESA
jgi:methylenetetrahydrofolate dehydrogenase (NADP+)/methenyltetrahydrofolate cyclohydrolase